MAESVSDSQYAILLDALRWIERHAGIDAPEYPNFAALAEAMGSLTRRHTASSAPLALTGYKPFFVRMRFTGRSSLRADRRNKAADRRDQRGAERDKIADDGDRVADNRDTEALLHGEHVDKATAFVAHRRAASDRNHAADDRKAAADDRLASAADREASTQESEAAVADNP